MTTEVLCICQCPWWKFIFWLIIYIHFIWISMMVICLSVCLTVYALWDLNSIVLCARIFSEVPMFYFSRQKYQNKKYSYTHSRILQICKVHSWFGPMFWDLVLWFTVMARNILNYVWTKGLFTLPWVSQIQLLDWLCMLTMDGKSCFQGLYIDGEMCMSFKNSVCWEGKTETQF